MTPRIHTKLYPNCIL